MANNILLMNVLALFFFCICHESGLVASNVECPNDEVSSMPIHRSSLLLLEGFKHNVSLVLPRPCICYNMYTIKNPNSANPVSEVIISGKNGTIINSASRNCTVTFYNLTVSDSGVRIFQRRNYTETKNGVTKFALLQWNLDVVVLGKTRCGIEIRTPQTDEEISHYGFCEAYYDMDKTNVKVEIVLYVDSMVMEGGVLDGPGFVGRIVAVKKYGKLSCKVGLSSTEYNITDELRTLCVFPLPTTEVSGCQPRASQNLLIIGFGILLAWTSWK